MKKIISLILVVLFITACGKKEEGFYLKYNGKDIKLDTAFDVNVNGQYKDSFESANCAFGNRDVTYIYDDIEVETFGNDKNELIIYSIVFTNEKVKTNEGIGIYDSIEEVIEKYGENYTKDDNKYTYKRDNTSLVFITSNDIIESIEYQLNDLN